MRYLFATRATALLVLINNQGTPDQRQITANMLSDADPAYLDVVDLLEDVQARKIKERLSKVERLPLGKFIRRCRSYGRQDPAVAVLASQLIGALVAPV